MSRILPRRPFPVSNAPASARRPRRDWSRRTPPALEGRVDPAPRAPGPAPRAAWIASAPAVAFDLWVADIHRNATGTDYIAGNVQMTGSFPHAGILRVRLYWSDGSRLLGTASTLDSVTAVRAGDHHGGIGYHFHKSVINFAGRPWGATRLVAVVDPDNAFAESSESNNRSVSVMI
jgi:hypothetical protein